MDDQTTEMLFWALMAVIVLLAPLPAFQRLRSGNVAIRRNERQRRRQQETNGRPLDRTDHRFGQDLIPEIPLLIAVGVWGVFAIGWDELSVNATSYGRAWWLFTRVVWSGYLLASVRLVIDRNRPQPVSVLRLLRQALRSPRRPERGRAPEDQPTATLDAAWDAPLGRVALGTTGKLAGQLILVVRAEFVPEWDVWMTGPRGRGLQWVLDAGRGRVLVDLALTRLLTRSGAVWLTPEEDAELERRYFDVRRTYLAYRGPDYGPRRWWQIWRAKGLEYQGPWPLGRS